MINIADFVEKGEKIKMITREDLEKQINDYLHFDTYTSPLLLPETHTINEKKSAKWNEEEVKHINEERIRLKKEKLTTKSKTHYNLINGFHDYIKQEFKCSDSKAKDIWDFVCCERDAWLERIDFIEELADVFD